MSFPERHADDDQTRPIFLRVAMPQVIVQPRHHKSAHRIQLLTGKELWPEALNDTLPRLASEAKDLALLHCSP